MKTIKMVTILFALSLIVMAVPVFAFHNGSELKCNFCHTMHYSEGGVAPSIANGFPVDADGGGPFPVLLVKANITDLCLSCHKDNAYSGAPSVYNTSAGSGTQLPGGDFGYCAKGKTGTAMGALVGKGHNPFGEGSNISANFDKDDLNGGADGITPPGGASLSATGTEFVCTACHQVHGPESGGSRAYGYRLLLKTVNDYTTGSDAITSVAWIKDTTVTPNVIIAGPDGADLTVDESSTNHGVYKGGFSNWCSSCHPDFHGAAITDSNVGNGSDFVRHPTNTELGSMNTKYGTYSYVYPLVQVGGNWTKTTNGSGNVATTDKEMCLSCHKAHGSDNPDALRWSPSQASTLGQCNKCHQKGGGV